MVHSRKFNFFSCFALSLLLQAHSLTAQNLNAESSQGLTAQAMPAGFSPDESSAYVLPSARPAAAYAAQLSIPPGLGYPFQVCRLSQGAPSWLHLDCQKLTLTGHAPAGRKSSYAFRLDLADASGNQQSYPLALSVSNAPAVVALGGMPAASSPEAIQSAQPLPAAQNMPRLTRRPQPVPVATPVAEASNAASEIAPSPTPLRRVRYTQPADLDSAAAANLAAAGRVLAAEASPAATLPASTATNLRTSQGLAAGFSSSQSAFPTNQRTAFRDRSEGEDYIEPIDTTAFNSSLLSPPVLYQVRTDPSLRTALNGDKPFEIRTGEELMSQGLGKSLNKDSYYLYWPKCGTSCRVTAGEIPFVIVANGKNNSSVPAQFSIKSIASKDTSTASDDTPPQSGMYRYYFTFGDLLSKQDGSFSHSDLFLDFHADRSFLLPANYVNVQEPWYRPGINSYFDVRLTSVPAATQNCTQTQSSAMTTSTTTPSCTSSSSTTSGNLDTTTGAQVFLNSQKSASVGGGFYLPFMLPPWDIDKEKYATFIAPIAKIGFQTTIDNLGQTQQTTTTAQQSVMSTVVSGVAPVGSSSTFYKNYSYGGRVGIYHFPANAGENQAPSIEHYLDISMGRFSNLPSAVCANTPSKNPPCGTTNATYVYQRQYRIALEGLMQVPGTHGFSIGFSANVAQHVAGAHHYDYLPPDDLRFLFGYKFDVQNLVNILKKPAS